MKLLAIDTSSLACSVGVLHGDVQTLRYEEQAREHTRILLPMVHSALDEAALAVGDLDAIVLGNGPGSFIGMRIAASVAQGLAFAAGIRIVPVSSMAAVAAAAAPGQTVAVAQDAHMQQVYLGVYRLDEQRRVSAVVAERLHAQAAVDELAALGPVVAAGEGWRRYPELLAQNRHRLAELSEFRYPQPDALLRLGASAFDAGAGVVPQDVQPAYLRKTVAQRPGAGRP